MTMLLVGVLFDDAGGYIVVVGLGDLAAMEGAADEGASGGEDGQAWNHLEMADV